MDWLSEIQERNCPHLEERLDAERISMNLLLREHGLIDGDSEEVTKFVEEHIFLFKELYCGYQCKDNADCKNVYDLDALALKEKRGIKVVVKQLCIPGDQIRDPCMHMELNYSQSFIINAYIDRFKRKKRISDKQKAFLAFRDTYLKDLRALICTMLCPDNKYCKLGIYHLNNMKTS